MSDHLSPEQIEKFNEDGFLVVANLLDDDDLLALENEYAGLLDDVSGSLFAEGLIADMGENLPFGQRYPRLIADYPELHRTAFSTSPCP